MTAFSLLEKFFFAMFKNMIPDRFGINSKFLGRHMSDLKN